MQNDTIQNSQTAQTEFVQSEVEMKSYSKTKIDIEGFYSKSVWGVLKAIITICIVITTCGIIYHYATKVTTRAECIVKASSDRAVSACYREFKQ